MAGQIYGIYNHNDTGKMSLTSSIAYLIALKLEY